MRAAVGSQQAHATDARTRESDCPIVPTKFPNKGRWNWSKDPMASLNGHEGGNAGDGQGAPNGPGKGGAPLAEGMEGRGWAKGNAGPQNMHRTLSRVSMRSARICMRPPSDVAPRAV
jgi:hypothetical protein